MRVTFFLLLIIPAITNAQINRSATEFAKEQIAEYLTSKLFKDNPYKPVSYGELKTLNEQRSGIAWCLVHEFEVTETDTNSLKKTMVQKPYRFAFYLNEKMKVVKAESYYLVEDN